jgi:hypothetical protein
VIAELGRDRECEFGVLHSASVPERQCEAKITGAMMGRPS